LVLTETYKAARCFKLSIIPLHGHYKQSTVQSTMSTMSLLSSKCTNLNEKVNKWNMWDTYWWNRL